MAVRFPAGPPLRLLVQKQLKQGIQEQLTVLGNLPVLLVFLQVALGYRRVQLRADRRFLKSGIAAKFSDAARPPAGENGS